MSHKLRPDCRVYAVGFLIGRDDVAEIAQQALGPQVIASHHGDPVLAFKWDPHNHDFETLPGKNNQIFVAIHFYPWVVDVDVPPQLANLPAALARAIWPSWQTPQRTTAVYVPASSTEIRIRRLMIRLAILPVFLLLALGPALRVAGKICTSADECHGVYECCVKPLNGLLDLGVWTPGDCRAWHGQVCRVRAAAAAESSPQLERHMLESSGASLRSPSFLAASLHRSLAPSHLRCFDRRLDDSTSPSF
ncbi:hypothetical protein C8R47DRAFT_1321474 [Mycena vitilis]|nr:hypothetical protein C8R47DRAFT_1321474 [Mycena vitilis]